MRMTAAAVVAVVALWMIMMMGCSGDESIKRVIGMDVESWEEEMMEMNMMMELSAGREDLVESAGYGEEKLSKVSITGKLVCHHHAEQPPHPISGASVAIFCERSRKSKHHVTEKISATGSVGEDGDFLIDLPSHLHAVPNLEDVCLLRVVHLPTHSKCQTDGSRSKHHEIQLHSVDQGGARTYTANTINLVIANVTSSKKKSSDTADSKHHQKARRTFSNKNRKRIHRQYRHSI